MNENNLPKTVAFYQKANFVLRIALITAILWPAFGIVTALFLTPHNAHAIVPLIMLSPLVPMFLLLIGAPFQFYLLWHDPDAKVGFRWLFALIGVELAIGIYFAVVPVANDPGLTPLLILGASALFFLRLAQITRWLRVLITLLLIAITVIFIGGGRRKMQAELTPSRDVPVIRLPPPQATPTERHPAAPTRAATSAPTATPTVVPASDQNISKNAALTQQTSLPPPQPEPAKVIPPITSGPVAVTKDADNYEFGFWPCRRVAAAIHCAGYIKNEYSDYVTSALALSNITDNQGNHYEAQSWGIAYSTCPPGSPCNLALQPQQRQDIKLKVDGVVPSAKLLIVAFYMTLGYDQSTYFSVAIPISAVQ